MGTRTLLLAATLSAAAAASLRGGLGTPVTGVPLYKQCDPRWGADEMGVDGDGERSTICGEGCAMSCVAMGLAGIGAHIDGARVTPGSLNAWLEQEDGYECDSGDCNNLVLDAPERLTSRLVLVGESPKPPLAQVTGDVASGNYIYLAHVNDGHHFVLVTGTDEPANNITVHDPGYARATYGYDEVSDMLVYEVEAHVPLNYPVYKQCDPRWSGDVMAAETVCEVGCFMSSIAAALAGNGIGVPQQDGGQRLGADPGTLNTWLGWNDGYEPSDALIESVVATIDPRVTWPADGMHTAPDLSQTEVASYIAAGRAVIANVLSGGHFVLAVGVDVEQDSVLVNDSGFNRTSYDWGDVVGWRVFDIGR